jgi:protein-L-isoaspartate(D-aspartate) O-methyltransferase
MTLINSLIRDGWLNTERIIKAFQKIKRIDFLPEDTKNLAELNEALPISHGQTISQPLTVAFMIELLSPQPGEKILDIGSGSGWTSALLAEIVGSKGKIISVEVIPELKEFGEKNVAKYNFIKKGIVEFICADGSKGYKKEAPFDKILASASAEKIPQEWRNQLKIKGRIVSPVGFSIWVLIKKSDKEFEEIEHPGFSFVPLIEKDED